MAGKHSGAAVFTTPEGVQYLLDKYLTQADRDDLRYMNNDYAQDKFTTTLVKRLEHRSGSGGWIKDNYYDELSANASAIIGTNRTRRKLKSRDEDVDVYETRGGHNVYEDKRGKLREYGTGRYVSKGVFDE